MSFYTSLTGLNAATAQLGVTANNVATLLAVTPSCAVAAFKPVSEV